MPLQSQELVDPRKDLLKEVLLRWGCARLQANGTSMLPSLLPYDVVSLVRCSAGDLLPDDLVLCEHQDRWLLHRVVRLEGDWLHTRGDLLPFDDPPAPAENVIAKVVGLERFGRQRPIPSAGLVARIFARAEQALGFVAAAVHLYARLRHRLAKPVTRKMAANFNK